MLTAGNEPKLNSIIDNLNNPDKTICTHAYKMLRESGRSAVPLLLHALTNPREKIRWQALKLLEEINVEWTSYSDDEIISSLIRDLSSWDGFTRVRARKALTRIGARSVQPLVQALFGNGKIRRWEAAKTLSQEGDPSATGSLIKALVDRDFDIRWLAAEGLVAIGEPAVVPLLHELVRNSQSVWLRNGAHHVLKDLYTEKLKAVIGPVLYTLEHADSQFEVPVAAEFALNLVSSVC